MTDLTTTYPATKTVRIIWKCKNPACHKIWAEDEIYISTGYSFDRYGKKTLHYHPSRYYTVKLCPSCNGNNTRSTIVHGSYSPDHKCDPRCTGAHGGDCDCSCGGANHGSDYLIS